MFIWMPETLVFIYTNQAWRYDHLHNIVLVPTFLPKQLWRIMVEM